MDIQYDENLSSNLFFLRLQFEHGILLDTAPIENWIVCVPRSGSVNEDCLNHDEFLLSHILIPNDELPETHFINLNCQIVKLYDRKLIVDYGGVSFESRILFEEVFYTKDFLKYKVWCIERPLDRMDQYGGHEKAEANGELYIVRNLHDAINLISLETKSKSVFNKIDSAVSNFIKNNADFNQTTLEKLKTNTQLLYNHCFDILLMNKRLREKCQHDQFLLKSLKISVQTYMMTKLFGHLKESINVCQIERVENFNKIIRNLSDIHISELNLMANYSDMISSIKNELIKIDEFVTVVDKVNCLKKALNITTTNKKSDKIQQSIITIDDLIPLLIFVIIKSGSTNWIMNFIFLRDFHFTESAISGVNINEFGQESFLKTTLEAAILYIESGGVKRNLRNQIINEPNNTAEVAHKRSSLNASDNFVNHLFDLVLTNDESGVMNLFKISDTENGPLVDKDKLCHPLCVCINCKKKRLEITPNINERNCNGMAAIHLAAIKGLPKMLTLLLTLKPDINAVDEKNWTALHYAAANGHQNLLLLLLHAGININKKADDQHTSLHLSSLNGHSGCVKALLYFAEHMRIKVEIDAQTSLGNTALHYASKWCFLDIVETLLEYSARVDIPNKAGLTAIQVAHNIKIEKMLQDAAKRPKNYTTPILNSNFVYITDEDLCEDVLDSKCDKELRKVDKMLESIIAGEIEAVCDYFGIIINGGSKKDYELDRICHPLCSCPKCINNSANFYNLMSKKLYEKKMHINTANRFGFTALHVASMYGNLDLIKILLENKANPCLKTKKGNTALHLACKHSKLNATKILISLSNCDMIDIRNLNGDTALHIATRENNQKLVEMLLDENANTTTKNVKGQRPIDIAKSNFFLNIIKLLESD